MKSFDAICGEEPEGYRHWVGPVQWLISIHSIDDGY